jgi:hypothetical protein
VRGFNGEKGETKNAIIEKTITNAALLPLNSGGGLKSYMASMMSGI